jgi:Sideroflexins
MAQSYAIAVVSALTVALWSGHFIQRRYPPAKAQSLLRYVAFPSAVVASSLNCYIVRSPEITTGIPLLNAAGESVVAHLGCDNDDEDNEVTTSRIAAAAGVQLRVHDHGESGLVASARLPLFTTGIARHGAGPATIAGGTTTIDRPPYHLFALGQFWHGTAGYGGALSANEHDSGAPSGRTIPAFATKWKNDSSICAIRPPINATRSFTTTRGCNNNKNQNVLLLPQQPHANNQRQLTSLRTKYDVY